MRAFATSIFAIALLIAVQARATVSIALSVAELSDLSATVVEGRVVGVQSRVGSPSDAREIVTEITIAPNAFLRGARVDQVQFLVHGGQVGARRMVVPGEANFRVGEEVVVFLMQGGGALWLSALAQGKWNIVRDRTGIAWVGSAARDLELLVRTPNTTRANTMRLDELEALVRDAGAAR